MDISEVLALRKAFGSVLERQKKNPPPDLEEKKKRLRAVREFSVGNDALLSSAIKKLSGNGIRVIMAKDADEAIEAVLKEIGDEKLIVKSKSNVTKEIELTRRLNDKGIEAIETDIGDRIAQLLNAKPSHPTGPIAHLKAKTIKEGLSKIYNMEIGDLPHEIVTFVRDEIKAYLSKAEAGITGANAITEEEGSIVLAHNEGNIFEVIRQKKHIAITGIDKIYPSVEDAINMLKVLCFNATGSLIPSFVEILSGPSKTADVEKKFIRGVHSPHDIVLIILDNKRSGLIKEGFKELLYCIDCGNCLLHCPMYNAVGNYFAEGKYLGGKGLAYQSLTEEEINKKLELCLTCGKCRENCPLKIDVPKVIRAVRSKGMPQEIYYFMKSHLLYLYFLIRLKLGGQS